MKVIQSSNHTLSDLPRKKLHLEYPAAAVDIDNTLLDSRSELSDGVKKAVQTYISAGGKLVLVTGRPLPAAEIVYDALQLSTPLVCESGSLVILPHTGTILQYSLLDHGMLVRLLQIVRRVGAAAFMADLEKIFLQGEFDGFQEHLEEAGLEVVLDNPEQMTLKTGKMTVLGAAGLLKQIRSEIGDAGLPLVVTRSGKHAMDITPSGVNKGSGLRAAASYLNIPLTQFIGMGDSENDLSLFKGVGLSVAMGNAVESIRAKADRVAPGHDEDGAAWVLRELALSSHI
ncbi:MAG: HAD family hydrolase [Anaerolineales bacterium]|nr:HAD family hydrolase [Anaerolineales bacterium]